MALMAVGLFSPSILIAQDVVVVSDDSTLSFNWLSLILDNWEYITAILMYVLYRIIPTAKADFIKKTIDWIWGLIPDRKKGGGKH